MKYYLGLVGTGKISSAALADEMGNIRTIISAPPLNMRVNENIKHYLKITFDQLCSQIGMNYEEFLRGLKGSCFAMSGVYTPYDNYSLVQILNQLGIWDDSSLVTCEDANALLAANFFSIGCVVIASTGSNIFFRGIDMADPIRVDGWGSVLGDDGSGYYLGRICLRTLFKGLDGRQRRSAVLERYVLKHLRLLKIEDLVQWYYSSRKTVNWRADLADLTIPLVEAAELENDILAKKIVNDGAKILLKSMDVGFKKAQKYKEKFNINPIPVILEGGIFENSKIYWDSFQSKIKECYTDEFPWQATKPRFLPVVGALALAIANNKYLDSTNKLHKTLEECAIDRKLLVKRRENL
jgi:N-acetylglucosamine kinase-like BadF-type ATPase